MIIYLHKKRMPENNIFLEIISVHIVSQMMRSPKWLLLPQVITPPQMKTPLQIIHLSG
jgi:hypothetical protein